MRMLVILLFLSATPLAAVEADDLPVVPEGFAVDLVAREPLVSNPCVMAFDRRGRLFVAQGPQWRGPTPDTPGDRIDMLIDDDGDGAADRRQTFAHGFNSVQGIAWHGDDLWVANAPDLTVVRDTDADGVADKYFRVYTGLGNLEHSLHGLNFGPDGKLYMSKGNSKGYNRLDQLAPKAFRDLWGLPSPEGAPDYTDIESYTRDNYRRKYHTPQDDWGQQGGILRCDPYHDGRLFARNLEIVARGFRNPWDITFDDGFNWLGTDNDQTGGDKIFAPFHGAHFGWGHPWSFHWTGKDHLPTVPASTPLFEGSGAGVIHYHAKQFPEKYRNLFFVNDWMRREVYACRPQWDGAHMKCQGGFPPVFAHAGGGRSLPASSGRVFDPTDIEVGPDGALYILSWGHAYGATIEKGKQVDAGRVYRIRYAANPLSRWQGEHRNLPLSKWSLKQLLDDLGSDVAAWRVGAQHELLRRGEPARKFLRAQLDNGDLSTASQTWALWTLGRFSPAPETDAYLAAKAGDAAAPLITRIQCVRILAHRVRQFEEIEHLPGAVRTLLSSHHPRLRHAAVQAIWQASQKQWTADLLQLAAGEKDRVVFYATWNSLRDLASPAQRKSWLKDERAGVRLAMLLGLFHEDAISGEEAIPLRSDADPRVARLTNDWLAKTGKAEPLVQFDPPPGEYAGPVNVSVKTPVRGVFLTFTLDGSLPTYTSPRVGGPIRLTRKATLRVAVNRGNTGGSQFASAAYDIRLVQPYRHRAFVNNAKTPSGLKYDFDWTGLAVGKPYYTDRTYSISHVPRRLAGLPFLRTANNDDRSAGNAWLSMDSSEACDLIVGVDVRVNAPLGWMKTGQAGGFQDTELTLKASDADFRLYRKSFPAGRIVLGGNTNNPATASARGNYIVIFDRKILQPDVGERAATMEQVMKKMATADAQRGRELFLHPRGAGCVKCHRMEGLGGVLGPDLADIGARAKSPEVLIESILEPSKVITEGFAQQQVVTTEGEIYSGAVIEETGRSIKLVSSEAVVTVIDKKDIEDRIGSKLSPMPAGFAKMMSSQQIADIAAWLLTQKVVGDRAGFSFRDQNDKIDIHLGDQRIATYLKRHGQLSRRALVNVMTPAGIQVTRNFPPRKPEDIDPGYGAENGIIHPVMHPGIWISFGDIDGHDYWRLQAKAKFDGFIEPPAGDKTSGSFAVRNRLMSEDGKLVICHEITRYTFRKAPAGWLLQIEAEYKSTERDFYFGDQEESGLALRVASPLRVQGGNGMIVNDRGERNGAQIWGKAAKWFDYSGRIGGRRAGVLVAPSPQNPRPSWLHARDYGVVVCNPFPKQPQERREPYVKTWVRRGASFRLSYAMLIYDTPVDKPLDRAAAAGQLLKSFD